MSGVLVLGALHWDTVVTAPRLPRLDETLPGSAVDYRFGGKGGNQAVAAARMGAAVTMAGRVGDDAAGAAILAALDRAGIDRAAVLTATAPTGMSVAITDASGGYGAVIVSGANRENDGHVVISRPPVIALIQNEIPPEANRRFAAALADETRLIWNAAPARDADPALAARADLIIANRVEAVQLTGADDPETAARMLADRAREAAIVTLGGAGALLAERGAAPVHHPAHPAAAVSSHGAGDMFAGTLAARLDAGAALPDALRFAQAAAALFVAAAIPDRARIGPADVAAFLASRNSR